MPPGPKQLLAKPKAMPLTAQEMTAAKNLSMAWRNLTPKRLVDSTTAQCPKIGYTDSVKQYFGQKNQAAQGEEASGLVGEVLRKGGKFFARHYIDGLFWPVVAGGAWVSLPVVFVIRRTSTRRLSARPVEVLLDSTGLSLPRPIT